VYLQAVHGTPGPDGGQRPLPTLAECGFWGEDDALRRRNLNQPLDESLPRRVARLCRKGEVAPKVNARRSHAELEFTGVKELERRCASHQEVGVWREADMHALEPCRPSKPLSGGEQTHMPTMQPVKDSKGEDRPRSALHGRNF
jgi:hypothetical protein